MANLHPLEKSFASNFMQRKQDFSDGSDSQGIITRAAQKDFVYRKCKISALLSGISVIFQSNSTILGST